MIYNFSEQEFRVFRYYIDENLTNRFISLQHVWRNDLCCLSENKILFYNCEWDDWCNVIAVKNKYFFSLMDEVFDCFSGIQVFTKLDLKNVYYHFLI